MHFFYERTDVQLSAQFRDTRTAYHPHFHFQIELVMVLEGAMRAIVDGKEFYLSAGDMCVVFPYQIHDYEDIGRNRTVVLLLSPGEFGEFDAVYTSKVPKNAVVRDHDGILRSLSVQLAKTMQRHEPYRDVIGRGYGLILLGTLMRMVEFTDVNYLQIPALKRILHYCEEHYTEELSLDILARELNISKHYISRLLNSKLCMSFTDYLSLLRVQAACEKMNRSGMNISEIAYSCGFSSIRSFNRNFLRHIGMTPSAYIDGLRGLPGKGEKA